MSLREEYIKGPFSTCWQVWLNCKGCLIPPRALIDSWGGGLEGGGSLQ